MRVRWELTEDYNRLPTAPRHVCRWCLRSVAPTKNKKSRRGGTHWVSFHVGLLVNGPPRLAGMPFTKSSDELKRGTVFRFHWTACQILPSAFQKTRRTSPYFGTGARHGSDDAAFFVAEFVRIPVRCLYWLIGILTNSATAIHLADQSTSCAPSVLCT